MSDIERTNPTYKIIKKLPGEGRFVGSFSIKDGERRLDKVEVVHYANGQVNRVKFVGHRVTKLYNFIEELKTEVNKPVATIARQED